MISIVPAMMKSYIQEDVRRREVHRSVVLRARRVVNHGQWVAILSDVELVPRVSVLVGDLTESKDGQEKEGEHGSSK